MASIWNVELSVCRETGAGNYSGFGHSLESILSHFVIDTMQVIMFGMRVSLWTELYCTVYSKLGNFLFGYFYEEKVRIENNFCRIETHATMYAIIAYDKILLDEFS